MQLESMYQEIILDHYRNPHHKGLREPFDAEVHHVNPVCGDEVTLRVALKDVDGEPVVEDVSYDALGCSISQASASVLSDLVIGKPVGEAMRVSQAFLELMRSRGEIDPDEGLLEDAVAFAGVAVGCRERRGPGHLGNAARPQLARRARAGHQRDRARRRRVARTGIPDRRHVSRRGRSGPGGRVDLRARGAVLHQMLKPRARSCSRPSSVMFSGPHGGNHTQLMRKSVTTPSSASRA